MKMGWKTFNDRLALILMVAILTIFVASNWLALSETITGALIFAFGLITQFYFRRKEPTEPTS